MATKTTTIELPYISNLGSYLDELCLKWTYFVDDHHDESTIKIDFGQNMSNSDVFLFAIDFKEWEAKTCK